MFTFKERQRNGQVWTSGLGSMEEWSAMTFKKAKVLNILYEKTQAPLQ